MIKVLTEEVNAFKSRALNDKYVAIFMDATYIPLKRQTVSKEAIYIAIGIREDYRGLLRDPSEEKDVGRRCCSLAYSSCL
ncbi:hypothetical protein EfmAA610_16450 [Enterococcus faecium]|nr:hypothetical protein EfmAA610_16450 [Enterococcus faecium]